MLERLLSYQNSINKLNLTHPSEFNLVIFFILVVLLFWNRKKKAKPDLIDYDLSSVLRGFAIVIIIFHHLCRHVLHEIYQLSIFIEAGRVGVGLFLILSGYGLTESYKKKGLNDFFSSKLLKIYIPFVLVNILFLFLNFKLWNIQLTKREYIYNIIGMTCVDWNFWYMEYLFLAYLVFYCIFRMKIKDDYKVIIIAILSGVSMLAPGIDQGGHINAFSFVIGIAASVFKDKILLFLNFNKSKIFISLIFTLGISSISFFILNFLKENQNWTDDINLIIGISIGLLFLYLSKLSILDKLVFFIFYVITISNFAPLLASNFIELCQYTGITIAIIFLFMLISNKSYSVPYKFLGDISYELYLFHGAFMYTYDFILYKYPLEYSFFIYILLIIPLCYLAKIVFNQLEKLISSSLFSQNTTQTKETVQ